MKIIKLNAIDSTNNYLKQLSTEVSLKNYTVVTTDYQTKGKGQMQNTWHSDKGKNLLFSMLIRFKDLKIKNQIYLNFVISIAVYKVLQTYLNKVKIKWPNDIMSDQNKICGILIENSVKSDTINKSIIGIGLNVNQINFPKNLSHVTSLQKELNTKIDREKLLIELINSIISEIATLNNKVFSEIYNYYKLNLYKIEEPCLFKTASNKVFLGKIIGVSNQGKLQVIVENNIVKEFEVKEISLI